MATKLSILNAKYRNAKEVLYFLKIGNKIVAITNDSIPLKNNSKIERII